MQHLTHTADTLSLLGLLRTIHLLMVATLLGQHGLVFSHSSHSRSPCQLGLVWTHDGHLYLTKRSREKEMEMEGGMDVELLSEEQNDA